jgi:hypothetical protein
MSPLHAIGSTGGTKYHDHPAFALFFFISFFPLLFFVTALVSSNNLAETF